MTSYLLQLKTWLTLAQMVDCEEQEPNLKGKSKDNGDEDGDKVMGDYWSPKLSPYVPFPITSTKSTFEHQLSQYFATSSSSIQVVATVFPGAPHFAARGSHPLLNHHSILTTPPIGVVRQCVWHYLFAIQL